MRLLHVYIRKGEIYTQDMDPYISEWDHAVPPLTTHQLVPQGEYTPRDMAFLHVYIRIRGSAVATSYYQQLVPQGRNIPGTWHSSMYISEWDLHGAATTTSSVPQGRNIHPGTFSIPMYISEWDLHGAALRLLPAACATREKYNPGHGIPPCISEWDLTRCRDYHLCHKGNIHPGTWHTSIRMGSTAGAAQREIYTQGHTSMYISEWDLHGDIPQLVPQGEIYTRTWHSSMYISEWDPRSRTTEKYTPRDMAFLHIYQNGIYTVPPLATTSLCHKENIHPGTASEWDLLLVPPLATTSSLCHKGEIIYPGTWHSSMYIRMGSKRCRHY
jgi:hypothetical protein